MQLISIYPDRSHVPPLPPPLFLPCPLLDFLSPHIPIFLFEKPAPVLPPSRPFTSVPLLTKTSTTHPPFFTITSLKSPPLSTSSLSANNLPVSCRQTATPHHPAPSLPLPSLHLSPPPPHNLRPANPTPPPLPHPPFPILILPPPTTNNHLSFPRPLPTCLATMASCIVLRFT